MNYSETRQFENYVCCNVYKYNYLYEFLKKKIGPDCARKITMMHFQSDKTYGDTKSIVEYKEKIRKRTERLRRPNLNAIQKIENNAVSRFNRPQLIASSDYHSNHNPPSPFFENYKSVNRFFLENGFKLY